MNVAGVSVTFQPSAGELQRQFRDCDIQVSPLLDPDCSMPKKVRNISGCTIDFFKQRLDSYLKTVPDEPLVAGYTMYRRAESNSLTEMTRFAIGQHDVLEKPGNGSTGRRRPSMDT